MSTTLLLWLSGAAAGIAACYAFEKAWRMAAVVALIAVLLLIVAGVNP